MDIFNDNIYRSGKTDINCIAHIVRVDMKLRSVLQGEALDLFRSKLNF